MLRQLVLLRGLRRAHSAVHVEAVLLLLVLLEAVLLLRWLLLLRETILRELLVLRLARPRRRHRVRAKLVLRLLRRLSECALRCERFRIPRLLVLMLLVRRRLGARVRLRRERKAAARTTAADGLRRGIVLLRLRHVLLQAQIGRRVAQVRRRLRAEMAEGLMLLLLLLLLELVLLLLLVHRREAGRCHLARLPLQTSLLLRRLLHETSVVSAQARRTLPERRTAERRLLRAVEVVLELVRDRVLLLA